MFLALTNREELMPEWFPLLKNHWDLTHDCIFAWLQKHLGPQDTEQHSLTLITAVNFRAMQNTKSQFSFCFFSTEQNQQKFSILFRRFFTAFANPPDWLSTKLQSTSK